MPGNYAVYRRERHEVNTDPQRRCYYGAHASSEWVWSTWAQLSGGLSLEEANESVVRWRGIGRKTCEFVLGHNHPHPKDENCHCITCRPLERPCGCPGCEELRGGN
jgi:hypothetical protein